MWRNKGCYTSFHEIDVVHYSSTARAKQLVCLLIDLSVCLSLDGYFCLSVCPLINICFYSLISMSTCLSINTSFIKCIFTESTRCLLSCLFAVCQLFSVLCIWYLRCSLYVTLVEDILRHDYPVEICQPEEILDCHLYCGYTLM